MAFDGRLAEHDEILPSITDDADPPPPSAVERRLLTIAKTRDRRAYLRTLAAQPLYHPLEIDVAKDPAVRTPGTISLDDGRTVCPVYTAGVLPRPHPRYVYEAITLGALADVLPDPAERRVDAVAVNPCTPWSITLPTDADERAVWRTLTKDPYFPWPPDGLVTHAARAARGPLLHGLACGAQMCMLNGVPWNTLEFHGAGFSNERYRLSVWWGVTDRETWKAARTRLLGGMAPPAPWELVLDARVRLAATYGLPVPPGAWRDHIEMTLREMWHEGAPCPPGNDALLDDTVAELRALVGSIIWYEARFRADGLLPPGAVIASTAAWDLGRASMMARWGVACRYGTEPEVRRTLEQVSEQARRAYGSWEEFGAGYILGRCLRFDAEEFGPWYTDARRCFRTLATDPDSPWRTVPFRP